MHPTIPQIPAQIIPRSFDERVMVLPTGPTIYLPGPRIAGLLPSVCRPPEPEPFGFRMFDIVERDGIQGVMFDAGSSGWLYVEPLDAIGGPGYKWPAAECKQVGRWSGPADPVPVSPPPTTPPPIFIDSISPTTGEIARLPALVLTDPRLTDLDPVTWSRAADMLRPYFTQVIDFLTDQRDHSKLAGDGAHLLVGLKRIKAGQPDPAPRARAERVIRDAIAPSQASRAQSHRQSVLAFARLLVEWGICPDMPTLRDPVYAPDPWKYEASIVCPGGIVVNRRGPGVHHYLKGRCATSRAELEACKVELDQDYLRAEAAMHKRQDFIRQPAARAADLKTAMNAELANTAQEVLNRYADRTTAR
jgi:hypothetical protein